MKVLDPQSALLSNAEVYQFLQSNPPREPGPQIGAYPTTNLTGYHAIRKDFDRYTEEITPHVSNLESTQKWMPELVKRLRPFDLTKTEVLNIINVGIGMRAPQKSTEVKSEDGEDGDDDDTEMARDVQFFKVTVEEADERFPGDEGEERIREAITTIRDMVQPEAAVNGTNGLEAEHAAAESG